MYFITIINIFFAGLIEYSLGKNFAAILLVLNILLYLNKFNIKLTYMIILIIAIVHVLGTNLFISTASARSFLAAIYNFIILLVFFYLSTNTRKSNLNAREHNLSHLQFIMMFQTFAAILQSQGMLPILTLESRPSGLYSGALVFGFVQVSIALLLLQAKPNFLTYLNIMLLLVSTPFHRSKFVVAAIFLMLLFFTFFVNKRFYTKFFVGIITVLVTWFSFSNLQAIVQSLENSERVRRIIFLSENIDFLGGNLFLELGPLGSFPSTESFILYFYASFGIFALPLLFIALYRTFAFLGFAVLLIGLSVTEPLLSYSCLLFLLFAFSYFSPKETKNVVFSPKSV